MDIVYYGYFPTYEPYLCALIHIGIDYGNDGIDSYFELCRRYSNKFGNLIFVGMDENLNSIYTIGCKTFGEVIINAQNGFRDLYSIDSDLYYINTNTIAMFLPHIITKINNHGFFSNTAKRLFYYWYHSAYPRLHSFVDKNRELIREVGK